MSEFEWPSGTKPAVTVNLRGDVLIVDAVEDAPLVTITGHNGVDPAAFFARYTDEIARLTRERDEARAAVRASDAANDIAGAVGASAHALHLEELERVAERAERRARAAAIEDAARAGGNAAYHMLHPGCANLRAANHVAVGVPSIEESAVVLAVEEAIRALAAKPAPEEVGGQ